MKKNIFNRKRQTREPRTIDTSPQDFSSSISDELQNWQVTEIEGRATYVDSTHADSANDAVGTSGMTGTTHNKNHKIDRTKDRDYDPEWTGLDGDERQTIFNHDGDDIDPESPIGETHNEHIVVSLEQRNVTTPVGETAIFEAVVLNNGPIPATFGLRIDGWIDSNWLHIFPTHVRLNPGTRETITIHITPPQHHTSRAGTHHLGVIVLSPEYPRQRSQLNATLTIEPYETFLVEPLRTRTLSTSWYNRSTRLMVPITNNGNQQITLDLEGRDVEQSCTFEFLTPDVRFAQFGQGIVTLHPGQTVPVPVRVTPREQSFFRLQKQRYPFYITARLRNQADGEEEMGAESHWSSAGAYGSPGAMGRRAEAHPPTTPTNHSVTGTITNFPLIGPWHLLSFVGFGLTTLFGVGMALLVVLWLVLQPSDTQSTAELLAAASAAAPPVAIILQPSDDRGAEEASLPSVVTTEQIAQELNLGVNVPNAEQSQGETIGNNGADEAGEAGLALNVQSYFPNITGSRSTGGDGAVQGGSDSGLPVVQPQQVTSPEQTDVTSASIPDPSAPPAQNPMVASGETVLTYEQMFQMIGDQYGLDWRLLAAVAYIESGFDPAAVSNEQDMGLMQIRLATWNEWAPSLDVSDPFDAYSNVLVSGAYLNFLHNLFGQQGYPQEMWMLAAYNWGPDRLGTFLNSGRGWDEMPRSVQKYVSDILWIASSLPQ